jgi:hypothetical protein
MNPNAGMKASGATGVERSSTKFREKFGGCSTILIPFPIHPNPLLSRCPDTQTLHDCS